MERLCIRVVRDADAAPLDLVVEVGADSSVGSLADHLALATGHDGTTTIAVLWPPEHASAPLDRHLVVRDAGPRSGSSIRLVDVDDPAPAACDRAVPSPVELVRAGGHARRLNYGANEVDGVRIDVGTSIELCSTGATTGTRNGERVRGSVRLTAGDLVGAGDLLAVVRVDAELDPPPSAGATSAHAAAPPADDDPAVRPVELPDPPASVRTPGFPVLSAMVPLLMGVGLWFATRSIAAAAFVFFSFVFVVASGIETRRESRAEQQFREDEFHDDLAEALDELDRRRRTERSQARRVTPDGQECLARIDRLDPTLWSARLDDAPQRLLVSVGTGLLPGRHPLRAPSGQGRRDLRRELEGVVARHGRHELPVRIDLLASGGVAVVGRDESATDLARSLVLQAAAAVGPDQLTIEVLTGPGRRGGWDWASWLPHAAGGGAVRLLVADGASDDDVAAARQAAMSAGTTSAVAVLWLAPSTRGLPRHLSPRVEVTDDVAVLHRSPLGDRTTEPAARAEDDPGHVDAVEDIRADRLHEDEVLPRARRLAGLRPGGSRIDLGGGDGSVGSLGTLSVTTPPTVRWDEVLARPDLAVDAERVHDAWSDRRGRQGLAAPIGRAGSGVVSVDLELDGPHALVAGTTGAGKSELLRTWLGALALMHPPDRLTFLLVDYKGGAAFRSLVGLPHTVGLVTDLSGDLSTRALVSLRAEVTRRERLLERHGATDLSELRSMAVGAAAHVEVPPSLVVAVDEFATLANEVPGFVDGLVDVAQRGRSLGIHLLLATQRPAGVVTDHIRANTSLRICLRVADDDESRDVIGVPDAGRIDRATPGRAMVRIGADRPFPVQVAWSGGTGARIESICSRPLHAGSILVDDELMVRAASESVDRAEEDHRTQLDRAVQAVIDAALIDGLAPPRRPWLDPLPERLRLDELTDTGDRPGAVVIGRRDLPQEQRQDALVVDLERDGGVLVLGANRSGRTTTLMSLAAAFVHHRVDPAHVYAVDAGSALSDLRSLGGVGDVIAADDIERVTRLVGAVHTEVTRRRAGATGPRLILMVDGMSSLEELHERVNRGELVEQLTRIARDGRTVGVHLVVAAHRRAEVRPSLAAALGCRIDLRFPTEDDASMASAPASAASRDLPPGRCLHEGEVAQIAIADLGACGPLDPGGAGRSSGAPPSVPSLPERVSLDELGALDPSAPWRCRVGMDADTLDTVALDLAHHHAVVAGPSRSGRSSALAAIASSADVAFLARARPTSGGSGAPAPSGGWSGVWDPLSDSASFDDLVDAAIATASGGCPTVLAVDDLPDLLDGPEEALVESRLLEVMDRARSVPIRLVVSGEIDAMSRCYGDLVARLRSGRTGVLLRPDPDLHGGLLHATLSVRDDLPTGPGRGWLVHPTGARPVQMAIVDTGPT